MPNVPKNTPKVKKEVITQFLISEGFTGDTLNYAHLVGVRGYFRDSMGKVGDNDRGIYDDAIILWSPEIYRTFNANTDPSIERDGIASLIPGNYPYVQGRHRISRPPSYPALRPGTKDEELPVKRDGQIQPSVGIAINIHKGSYNTTSSAGCQTIYPSQWADFVNLVYTQMNKLKQKTIWYHLTEKQLSNP